MIRGTCASCEEYRAEVAALREDVARITTLREITGKRNAQLLKRAALRAEVAALRGLRRELAEARALLGKHRPMRGGPECECDGCRWFRDVTAALDVLISAAQEVDRHLIREGRPLFLRLAERLPERFRPEVKP